MTGLRDNPFPREAVATYGKTLKVTADRLSYMKQVTKMVDEYLEAFFEPERRYGGGIGLRGGHGSGKTHLLSWQAERVRALSSPGASVAYAKADSDSFFDLHKQFLTEIDQLRLFELVGLARKNVAIAEVARARATESLSERLKAPEDVQTLVDEGNLDPLQLFERLKERLKSSEVPESIPTVLVHVDGSVQGRRAFEWLNGEPAPDLEYIGVKSNLRQLDEERYGAAAQDVAAIQTLEAIAALHELAERPLVLLIDQLEVLLRAEGPRLHSLHSLLKKLVEQVGAHGALLLVAGNEESWRLPRDVGPRLITREPIPVGNLKETEMRKLLEAYLRDSSEQFTPEAVEIISRLSGCNPREVLRIAHHAFNLTEGKVSQAGEAALVNAAKESGSVADRERLALEVADQVLGGYGAVRTLVDLGDGHTLDRLLTTADGRPMLALLAAAATDRLDEVNYARQAGETWARLQGKWPQAKLAVVAVGYSSQEVRELFEPTSLTFVFEDRDRFAAQLNAAALDILAQAEAEKHPRDASSQELIQRIDQLSHELRGPAGPAGPPGPADSRPDPELLMMLEKITVKLDEIENRRSGEEQQVGERYKQSVDQLAESELVTQRARSVWGLIEQLDELETRLVDGDLAGERNLMRAMLVGNETSVQNQDFDFLGGLYIDLVSRETSASASERQRFETDMEALREGRLELLSEMRRVLRSKDTIDRFREQPMKSALIAGALFWVLGTVVISAIEILFKGFLIDYYIREEFATTVIVGLLVGISGSILTYALLNTRTSARHRRWQYIVERAIERSREPQIRSTRLEDGDR